MTPSSDAYHGIPYESCSHPSSHPDNLAVIAALFGLSPQSLDGARVLEIGCAAGGNLLPVAAVWPGSHFTGIDLSGSQIAEARAGAEALGLGNVELHAMSLEDLAPDTAPFDYIIAHGVYSWVAAPVRERLMALCGRLLKPMGVAYVSFNTLPGSAPRAALREMVRFRTRHEADPAARVSGARAFMAFLDSALGDRQDGHAVSLRQEIAQTAGLEDFYLAHEHLEEVNEPCYFHEFIGQAERHGLQFLGEAEIQTLSAAGFPPDVRAGLREMSSGITESEQYGDFVRGRAFRQTLLCRAGTEPRRAISAERVRGFRFSSVLEPVPDAGTGTDAGTGEAAAGGGSGSGAGTGQFRDGDGRSISVRDPLTRAALLELRAAGPVSLAFEELLERALRRCGGTGGTLPAAALAAAARTLGGGLLACLSASRGMEFHLHPGKFHPAVSAFPEAFSVARWQAGRGARVTSLRHENIRLGPAEQTMLRAADGRRSLESLEREFPDIRPFLERCAGLALLVS